MPFPWKVSSTSLYAGLDVLLLLLLLESLLWLASQNDGCCFESRFVSVAGDATVPSATVVAIILAPGLQCFVNGQKKIFLVIGLASKPSLVISLSLLSTLLPIFGREICQTHTVHLFVRLRDLILAIGNCLLETQGYGIHHGFGR